MTYILPSLQYQLITLLLFLGISLQVLEKFLMILPHKLLADTHITKTPTTMANDLLACLRIANLYLISIVYYIKITPCGLGNTLMAYRAQTDHILPREEWKNSTRSSPAYSSVDLGSDHRTVAADLKISLRAPRIDKKIVQRDIQALNSLTDLQDIPN